MGKYEEVKIDVIVPVYNIEKYVVECIESLAKQTIPVRIIVVDDGSQDNSKALILNYQKENKVNLTYLEQENQGLSAARNTGLLHAKAQYVAFMDSDDFVSHDYYENMLVTIEQTDADFVCSNIYDLYQNHEKLRLGQTIQPQITKICSNDINFREAMLKIFPMAQNKLWRRTFITENKLKFIDGLYYEDLAFFYQCYLHANCIAFTEQGKFYYRQRKGSIVKTATSKILDIIPIFDEILSYYKKNFQFDFYQEELEYLLVRNCLVASSRRLSYSKNRLFICKSLKELKKYTNNIVPRWKKNKYIKKISMKHLYLYFLESVNIPFVALFLQKTARINHSYKEFE